MIINSGFEKGIHTFKLCCQTTLFEELIYIFITFNSDAAVDHQINVKGTNRVFLKRGSGLDS